jgi:hypothetical protein
MCFGGSRVRRAQSYHNLANDDTCDVYPDVPDAATLRENGLQRSATCSTLQQFPWEHEVNAE